MKKLTALIAIVFTALAFWSTSYSAVSTDSGVTGYITDAVDSTTFEAYTSSRTEVYGSLVQETLGLGIEYTTATTFNTFTSYNSSKVSAGITADAGAGTLTLGSSQGGDYDIQVDISVTAGGGPELTYGVFLNATSEMFSFVRSVSGEHHHPPTLANISGGSTFEALSSIEALYEADGVSIQINEVAETPGFLYDLTFNGGVLYPTHVEFINTLYDGNNSNDAVEVQVYSNTSTAWHDMLSSTNDLPDAGAADPYRYYLREFAIPEPIADHVDTGTRETLVRVVHTDSGNATHDWYVDKVQLHDSHNASALSFSKTVTLPNSAVVSVKMKGDSVGLPVWVNNVHVHIDKH